VTQHGHGSPLATHAFHTTRSLRRFWGRSRHTLSTGRATAIVRLSVRLTSSPARPRGTARRHEQAPTTQQSAHPDGHAAVKRNTDVRDTLPTLPR